MTRKIRIVGMLVELIFRETEDDDDGQKRVTSGLETSDENGNAAILSRGFGSIGCPEALFRSAQFRGWPRLICAPLPTTMQSPSRLAS